MDDDVGEVLMEGKRKKRLFIGEDWLNFY